MAAKRKTTRNPDATVHRQVKPGEVVTYQRHTYADRCTSRSPAAMSTRCSRPAKWTS
jgi:hypothetical protein